MLWWTYQQLRMGKPDDRIAVIEKLVTEDDPESVGPLIFALKDKDAGVRCVAAKSLRPFNDRKAVEPLIVLLRDPVPLARAAAAETLSHLGDPGAVNNLVGLLRDPDPIVRSIGARSLNRLGWRPGTDSQRVLQILAMGSLHQLVAMGPEGVGPLLDTLRNGAPNKQFAAVKALGDITDPRVVPAMRDALKKPSPAVRIAALGIMERMGDPALFHDVEKLLRDENPSVRGAAVEAATRCGATRAVPSLLTSLKDSSWEVRKATADALGFLGESTAVEGLCEMVFDPDRDVRESVITALGKICDRRAISPLVQAMLDAETTVRSKASGALRTIDRHWEESEAARATLPKIQAALRHPDYWVRHAATKVLEQMQIDINSLRDDEPVASAPRDGRPPHIAAAVLADMLFDRDGAFRLAAAIALGKVREYDAKTILSAAIRDSDLSVRTAAQAALTAMN
ncbi:MAG TPA: HEAT repeat domain-containing protein [Candidatus Sulfotelmatobacter sp.]|jgi:HEAT repeat protein|nr:HEAT repeat domain-containing protein [Candidatus Sulfotelmatobacter sp.]